MFLLFVIKSRISSVSFKLWPCGSPFYSLWPTKFPKVFPWYLVQVLKLVLKRLRLFLLFIINSRISNVSFKLWSNAPFCSLWPPKFTPYGPFWETLVYCNFQNEFRAPQSKFRAYRKYH